MVNQQRLIFQRSQLVISAIETGHEPAMVNQPPQLAMMTARPTEHTGRKRF